MEEIEKGGERLCWQGKLLRSGDFSFWWYEPEIVTSVRRVRLPSEIEEIEDGKAGHHNYYIIGQSCDYLSSFIVIIIITRPDGKAAYQPKLWAGNELGGWKPGRRCPSKCKNIQSEISFNICKHHTFLNLDYCKHLKIILSFWNIRDNPGGQWGGKSYGILMWSGNEVRRLKTSDGILNIWRDKELSQFLSSTLEAVRMYEWDNRARLNLSWNSTIFVKPLNHLLPQSTKDRYMEQIVGWLSNVWKKRKKCVLSSVLRPIFKRGLRSSFSQLKGLHLPRKLFRRQHCSHDMTLSLIFLDETMFVNWNLIQSCSRLSVFR